MNFPPISIVTFCEYAVTAAKVTNDGTGYTIDRKAGMAEGMESTMTDHEGTHRDEVSKVTVEKVGGKAERRAEG